MFDTIKNNVDILVVAEKMFDIKYSPVGDRTFEPEDKTCPFCGHKDCFKLKVDGPGSIFKCFSCDKGGDVISLVSQFKNISDVEAAHILAKEFKVKLPNDFSPVQEVFNLAAEYYLNCLKESGPAAELAGISPLVFQETKRGHTLTTLERFKIGWSDGKLIDYLEAFGIDKSIIAESGLINKKGFDFLPSKCFIYPHFVRGRVSHFTFKDPLKQKEFQIPNRHKLNGHCFYNSDSIKLDGPVIVVEGENDMLSVVEAGWVSGVICCNGSISSVQLEWISTNLAKRDVISIFDTDPAGDKYREKLQKLVKNFSSLTQIKLNSGVKDIDEFLKAGGDLQGALASSSNSSTEEVGIEVDSEGSLGIIEKNGSYFKIRRKDGDEFHIKISNFIIQMRNIYIKNGERERDILVVREDGMTSEPIKVNSDCKVSLKPFKTLISNAVDASFYGKEEDLTAMWEYIYSHSNEKIVYLPDTIGRVPEFKGWLFRDIFITDTGATYKPDDTGVIWISNNSVGLKPVSIIANIKSKESSGMPSIDTDMSEEERDELLAGFISNLGTNIGSLGDALTITGWAWSTIYVDNLDRIAQFFPLLYFWGRFGKGKSSIIRWVECLYNMEDFGYTTFAQLNSGVSFSRKLNYYAGLPMCVDELRAGRDEAEWYGTFRSWYDRIGKATGTREGFGVNETPIKATIMFGGEDQFLDPATRSRCIPIRISANNRETVETFTWIDNRKLSLSAIGYHWILNYGKIPHETIVREFKELEKAFKKEGVPDRAARNWAGVSIFANRLCERYFQEFNYMQYVIESAKVDVDKQKDDDTLIQFWEVIEGMQSVHNPKISGDHFKKVDNILYIWFNEVFRLFVGELPYSSKETFSKGAILEGLKDEAYFMRLDRTSMGMQNTTRRVLLVDLNKAPEVLQNIANYLG